METGLNQNKVISLLTKSPHGDLKQYLDVGLKAAAQDPQFLARLVAWNEKKGQIRDSKVALPVISLSSTKDEELVQNALAHMAMLDPRNLVRAVRFSKSLKGVPQRAVKRMVERYLSFREQPARLERVVLQHRQSMKELYALNHIKPGPLAQKILFDGAKIGVFKDVAALKDMSPTEAAGVIISRKIPFLTALGAMGARMKEPDVVLALIQSMSPLEVVTNTKMLERLGVKSNPALRGAFEKAMMEAAASKKSVLKTSVAAKAVGGSLGEKLAGVQEKQLDSMSIQGDWLILADRSGSMTRAIETSKEVAAVLARLCNGSVTLTFFNVAPTRFNVTGKTLEEIKTMTRSITATGGTSISCGLRQALDEGGSFDGIAIVSDGEETGPGSFAKVYAKMVQDGGKEVPVYLFDCDGGRNNLGDSCAAEGIELHTFDCRGDHYSIPNLVQTMRVNRYSLVQEIMDTPLLKVSDVIPEIRSSEAAAD